MSATRVLRTARELVGLVHDWLLVEFASPAVCLGLVMAVVGLTSGELVWSLIGLGGAVAAVMIVVFLLRRRPRWAVWLAVLMTLAAACAVTASGPPP